MSECLKSGCTRPAGHRGTHVTPPEERFWSKVKIESPDECWPWTGSLNGGYGQMYLDGRPVLAHRFVVGAIDSDLHVMHLCDNPPCCNPAHLRLATQAENNADMMAKGRNGTNGYEKRTHCKHGHEYTPENTYRKKNGARNCKECVTISTRKRRAKGLR